MNEISEETARSEYTRGPDQADVDALRSLLDLMENFGSNDQRARYLLCSDWLRERERVTS